MKSEERHFADSAVNAPSGSGLCAYEDVVLVERGERGGSMAMHGDEERGVRARGVGGDAGEEGDRAVRSEAERAHERAAGWVPPVGRHHEQPVAAHGRRQVERRRGAEREIQLHAVTLSLRSRRAAAG